MRNWINICEGTNDNLAADTPRKHFSAYRYHNELNRFSNDLRLGTWYAANPEAAQRYFNPEGKSKLGGTQLIQGTINCQNPFLVKVGHSGVLYDAWVSLPFGHELKGLAFAKTAGQIKREAERLVDDHELLTRILSLPQFTIVTMITERVAANWCIRNGYDLIVLGKTFADARELFDFKQLFVLN